MGETSEKLKAELLLKLLAYIDCSKYEGISDDNMKTDLLLLLDSIGISFCR